MEQRSLYLIRQALNAMFKRRRMVLLLFLAVFGAANIGNLLRDPVYRASAKVMLTNERAYPEVSPLPRPSSVDRPPNETLINSEIQLIRSRDLLRRVHFDIAARREESGDDRPVPSIQSMENRMSVLRKPSSNVLEISYRSSAPDEAIEIVNTLVSRYVRYAIEKHNEPGALEFFTEQTETALALYQESDVALERYDASHGLTSIAIEKDQMLRQRAQLEADLRRTEADIVETATRVASVEAELEYIPEHEATEVDMIPNPMLAYLRQNLARMEMESTKLLGLYTPQHRLVQDIESEVSALKQQVVAQETSIIGRKRMSTTSVRRSLEQAFWSNSPNSGQWKPGAQCFRSVSVTMTREFVSCIRSTTRSCVCGEIVWKRNLPTTRWLRNSASFGFRTRWTRRAWAT